jgi:hypothetical protein
MLPSEGAPLSLIGFQQAFLPLVGGVIVAIILSFFLHETGLGHQATPSQTNSILPKVAVT